MDGTEQVHAHAHKSPLHYKPTSNNRDELRRPQDLPLPAELLHEICSNLGTSDFAAFRLACKSFAEIGKEHLVDDLTFF